MPGIGIGVFVGSPGRRSGPSDPAAALPAPMFRWLADEGSGSTLHNSFTPTVGSQSDYDATLTGSPTWSARGIGCVANQYGKTGSFGPHTISGFTHHAAFKRFAGSVDAFNYYVIFNDNNTNFELNAKTTSPMESNGGEATIVADPAMRARVGQYMIGSRIYNGSKVEFYLNGCLIGTATALAATIDVSRFQVSTHNDITFANAELGPQLGYSAAHTLPQLRRSVDYIRGLMVARGVAFPVAINSHQEGDSISVGATATDSADGYNWLGTRNAIADGYNLCGRSWAVASSTLTELTARAAGLDAQIWPGRRNILSVFVGTNDLAVSSAAVFVAALKVYCLARIAAGWEVLLCNMLVGQAGVDSVKAAATTALIAADASFRNGLCDFASIPDMTYVGALHPDTAGHAKMCVKWVQAMEALIDPTLPPNDFAAASGGTGTINITWSNPDARAVVIYETDSGGTPIGAAIYTGTGAATSPTGYAPSSTHYYTAEFSGGAKTGAVSATTDAAPSLGGGDAFFSVGPNRFFGA